MHYILEQYVDLQSPHDYVAVALWIIHAHQFKLFMITPRLALLSPVRGCGKTTLLNVIERLLPPSSRADNITPAAIWWLVDQEGGALLIDEADNLDLRTNGPLRAVFDSGHRKGGHIIRVIGGRPRRFKTFAPMAIAAIGSLPLPLSARCIRITMQRSAGTRKLRSLDTEDQDLATIYGMVWQWWAGNPAINHDPEMPGALRNRARDNWRPLIAIADAFGGTWGSACSARSCGGVHPRADRGRLWGAVALQRPRYLQCRRCRFHVQRSIGRRAQ